MSSIFSPFYSSSMIEKPCLSFISDTKLQRFWLIFRYFAHAPCVEGHYRVCFSSAQYDEKTEISGNALSVFARDIRSLTILEFLHAKLLITLSLYGVCEFRRHSYSRRQYFTENSTPTCRLI